MSGQRPRAAAAAVLLWSLLAIGGAPPVAAQAAGAGIPGPCCAVPQVGPRGPDGGEAVRGTLVEQVDGERVGVEGVEIAVSTADGEPVEVATTDGEGSWVVELPGPGDYVVALDESTLPGEVALRDPERATLEVGVRPGQRRTLLFPLGEGSASTSRRLANFLQLTLDGIKLGAIIAITAIGLSLIFGTTGLVNFAHGELVTFGAVVAYFFNASRAGPGWHLLIAGTLAVGAGALFGAGLDWTLWRPLRRRQTSLIAMLVISIGLSLALRNLIQILFGGSTRPFLDYNLQQALRFGPVAIVPRDLAIIGLSLLVLAGVGVFLQRTRAGKAMRAVADNRDLAESSGIDVRRVILLVWAMGGALAAFGGVLLGTTEQVNFNMGFNLLLLMFAGVILGGLGTAYGAVVGSMVVGIVTQVSTVWFSSQLKFVWALLVLVVVLLVRPQGILGRAERIG